jgi:hypothetical protein
VAAPAARYILRFLNDCGEPIETFESATPFHAFSPGEAVELRDQPGCWEVDTVSHQLDRTKYESTIIVQMTIQLRERR